MGFPEESGDEGAEHGEWRGGILAKGPGLWNWQENWTFGAVEREARIE